MDRREEEYWSGERGEIKPSHPRKFPLTPFAIASTAIVGFFSPILIPVVIVLFFVFDVIRGKIHDQR